MAQVISSQLLQRFQHAINRLSKGSACFLDQTVDVGLHKWLGDDLPWQDSIGVAVDEHFFISTLYGNMNLSNQRTMIRKFFEPLFVQAANREIRNFTSDMPGYAGLRSPWMKDRLCRMASILQNCSISMQDYVEELQILERKATAENPTPALDKIVQDHGATGVKTLSVFVRDCVRGNCFPIDLRVQRQLRKYGLPENEKLLVRMSLELGKNPRELARLFYEAKETSTTSLVDLNESEPCVFYTSAGDGWSRDRAGKLIRETNALMFDTLNIVTDEWEPCKMMLENDGLYHWRDPDRKGHWWGFLSGTETHAYLTSNFVNPNGDQGVQIFIWPKS